jgi:hypothetical protein
MRKIGRFVGRRRDLGYTTKITIVGVYTAEEFYNLTDIDKIELKSKNLAVFENMEKFTALFDHVPKHITRGELPKLYEDSEAWGLKLTELKFEHGNYTMDYTFNGVKDDNEISPENIFMFFTVKNLGTGKHRRKRNSRKFRKSRKYRPKM